jgi:hypothetical protein
LEYTGLFLGFDWDDTESCGGVFLTYSDYTRNRIPDGIEIEGGHRGMLIVSPDLGDVEVILLHLIEETFPDAVPCYHFG